ncbi:Vacuolar protein-sorting-associated protein 36 [Porphyridium purpureum]|uniref:Vacuolar protein-sorting-associated protein 36 n=1 Tax=Porphyridium purpureum TaxID=35688 RepID=A0A5J4Z600_PORPP|nr:Vacuolar protein-sorting-associated protein 36 [Porphyridium purpureum]|eukprot:POR7814..scf295_1
MVSLAPGGAPQMQTGERVLAQLHDVRMYEKDKDKAKVAGALHVTNHRLVFKAGGAAHASAVSGAEIAAVNDKSSMVSARLEVVWKDARGAVRFELAHKKERTACMDAMKSLVTGKEWTKIPTATAVATGTSQATHTANRQVAAPTQTAPGQAPTQAPTRVQPQPQQAKPTTAVGVAAVIQREKAKDSARQATLDSSFGDLDALISGAAELVSVAQKLQAALARDELHAAEMSPTELALRNQQNEDLGRVLQDLGIESPVAVVSKGIKRSKYHEQLARELAQFLPGVLERIGGVATSVDAYCLYIRARSSIELVAPDDFRAACKLFEPLALPLRNVTLSDNVAAIECSSAAEPSAQRLLALAKQKGSISPMDLVRESTMPISLALKQLEQAEQLGRLCRDEHLDHGTRFYPNLFMTSY